MAQSQIGGEPNRCNGRANNVQISPRMTYVKSRRRWYGTLAQRFRPLRDLPQGVASIRFTVSWERNPNNSTTQSAQRRPVAGVRAGEI